MIRGSCLCGGVALEVARVRGPFELCHCSRCRKAFGSAYAPMIGVDAADLRWLQGRELVREYAAPLRESAPPYRAWFCGVCGSPVPNPTPAGGFVEIPAGLLDDDPGMRPDRHIYVEHAAVWCEPAGGLPRLDRDQVRALRAIAPR